MKIEYTDNTDEVLRAFEAALARALETIGGMGETYAKGLAPSNTGALRNSITHMVEDKAVSIGANIHYAPYVELGTGPLYEAPPAWLEANAERGRGLDHWVYKDSEGKWHTGYPQPARPFIRPAVEDHMEEYMTVLENELKNG